MWSAVAASAYGPPGRMVRQQARGQAQTRCFVPSSLAARLISRPGKRQRIPHTRPSPSLRGRQSFRICMSVRPVCAQAQRSRDKLVSNDRPVAVPRGSGLCSRPLAVSGRPQGRCEGPAAAAHHGIRVAGRGQVESLRLGGQPLHLLLALQQEGLEVALGPRGRGTRHHKEGSKPAGAHVAGNAAARLGTCSGATGKRGWDGPTVSSRSGLDNINVR